MRALRPDRRAFQVAEPEHLRAGADAAITHDVVRTDAHAVAQRHAPFEHAADIDEDVRARLDGTANIDARGVSQPYTAFHQGHGDSPLGDPFDLGQLCGAVDAKRLVGVGKHDCRDRHARADGLCNHVGQVVLALRIAVGKRRQPLLQPRRRRHQDARVHFVDRAFGGCRVALLDDAHDLAAGITDDAAVARRFGQPYRQQRDAGAGRRHQLPQRRRRRERHVAVEHQRRAGIVQMRDCLQHRVAGTQLCWLGHKHQVFGTKVGGAHLIATVPDHDDRPHRAMICSHAARGVEHVG